LRLRIVFDTSTLVGAALRPDSVPERALQRTILFHCLFATAETLGELERVLRLKKFDRFIGMDERLEFAQRLRRDAVQVDLQSELLDEVRGQCRDRNDDVFLAVCRAVKADVLVSSDQDLLIMNPWKGIQILTPAEFLAQVES
jgi:putative PIN family toxin of toxin-antitoxin system